MYLLSECVFDVKEHFLSAKWFLITLWLHVFLVLCSVRHGVHAKCFTLILQQLYDWIQWTGNLHVVNWSKHKCVLSIKRNTFTFYAQNVSEWTSTRVKFVYIMSGWYDKFKIFLRWVCVCICRIWGAKNKILNHTTIHWLL